MHQPSTRQLLNPLFFLGHLWSSRGLVRQFAVRDFQLRFKGTVFGMLWSVAMPLVMLLVYTFVFSVVFQARWGTLGGDSRALFAVILFGNLLPYNFFAEVVGTSSGLMLQHQNLIKKVVFPLEVLPASRLAAATLQTAASFLVLLAGAVCLQTLHWQVALAPLVLIPLAFYALGLSYIVSALTVFVRDCGQIIAVILTLLMFLSPIFYPPEAVPESLRWMISLNPLALVIEQFRALALFGEALNWQSIALLWVSSLILATLGFAFFMKTKPSFADVL